MRKTPPSIRARLAPRSAIRDSHHVLPLHHRIYVVLRGQLTEGRYPPDRPLPGEHHLAEQFKASRVTIRRVLEQLHKERLIDRRHGVGTFPVPAPEAAGDRMSYLDHIAATSHTHRDVMLEFARIPAPLFLTERDARFGPTVLKIARVASIKGVPHHILTTYVPGELARRLSRRSVGNRTVLELLRKTGITPRESELSIGAVTAGVYESQHLRVSLGAPLLHAVRVSRLPDGRPIEYNQMLSIAATFGYRFTVDWRTGAVVLPSVE